MKNVTIIVSQAPDGQIAETLRMSVGQTLDDGNRVRVVLVDDGVYAGLGHDKSETGIEIEKSLSTLEMLKKEIFAVQSSVDDRGVTLSRFGVKLISREDFVKMLKEPGVVIG